MSQHFSNELPTAARLLKATAAATAAAALILLTAVLPAEYGIDPTGIGARLGLLALSSTAEAAPAPIVATAASQAASAGSNETTAMAAQAAAVFGKQPGQSFDAHAVSPSDAMERTDTMTLTLAPGKGAELKAMVEAGQGFVFRWTASADLAVDMHGERPDAKDEYTTYSIAAAQRKGAGTFVAPFAGQHGWYWRNRGNGPVTVQLSVTGFHTKLSRPGH